MRLIAVFGTDDRGTPPPRYAPIRDQIGLLLNVRQRSVCTAFCVEPDIIGTAAHCLFKTDGEKPSKLADFWFARNYDRVRDYARIAGADIGAGAQNIIAGSTGLTTLPPIAATRDWAFIRLTRPICAKGVLPIEPQTPDQVIAAAKAGRIFQISYHKDYTQWQPAYSQPCKVDRSFANTPWKTIAADFIEPENLLLHTCDTGGGSSGSPLLMETPQGPKVVGINVGTYVQSRMLTGDGQDAEPQSADAIANTAVATAAFTPQLAIFRRARILSGVAALKELQQRLHNTGHYTGPIDGTYGPALKLAIDAFELSLRLPPTGLASEDVLARLRLGTPSPSR